MIKFLKYTITTIVFTTIFITCLSRQALANENIWQYIKGTPVPNSLYLGMWTFHLNAASRSDRANNELIGFVYKNIFAGTFLNSYGNRSYAAGVQRNLYTHNFGHGWHYNLGYRVGGIYGYDGRLSAIAEETPIVPFASIMTGLRYKHFGWEVAYTGIVVSTSFYISF